MDPAAIEKLAMPVTYARHLTRLFDPDALFEGTGIRIADLDDPNLRITVRQAIHYIQNALSLAKHPDWYLEWVGSLSDHFHGAVSLALTSAPSLGDVIDAFTRYFPSRIPYMHMESRQEDGKLLVELVPLIELGEATPLLVETPLLILMHHLETVYNVNIREATLELRYPPTPYAENYPQHFRCELLFDAPRNALIVPLGWRSLSNLGFNESSWAHAVSQCEATLGSSRERDTFGEVRELLCRAFEKSDRDRPLPTLSEIADSLHITRRTLIRRLRGLGVTYQQTMDDFLLARAQEMLANDSLKVKEVAAALGFDNPANFGKAFKRWSGMSPDSYRKGRVLVSRD